MFHLYILSFRIFYLIFLQMCSHGPLTVIFGALLHITQHYTTLHYTRVLSCFHPTFWEIWEHFGKKSKPLKHL